MTSHGDRSVQLLVVGAGPVGLVAALAAVRRGLAVEIIDQTFRGFGRGYAALLHPSSVRLLDELGLGPKLREQGRELSSVTVRVDEEPPLTLRLPSPAFSIGQSTLEEMLLTSLRAAGVSVQAPLEASMIQQDAGVVRVAVARKELVTLGSPGDYSEWQPVDSAVISANFVLGADGYASKVRSALGAEVASLGATQGFAIFEVPKTTASAGVELGFADGVGAIELPLPGQQVRLGFQLKSGLDLEPDAQRLRELLVTHAPWFRDEVSRVDFGAIMHFERRLARRFGRGRVWLAGDAAHITSPFGAQSMNLGLAEANEFVERVAACVRGSANTDSLERYGYERQREWYKLFGVHVRYDLLPHAPSWLAKLAHDIGPALPASGQDLAQLFEQLGLQRS